MIDKRAIDLHHIRTRPETFEYVKTAFNSPAGNYGHTSLNERHDALERLKRKLGEGAPGQAACLDRQWRAQRRGAADGRIIDDQAGSAAFDRRLDDIGQCIRV